MVEQPLLEIGHFFQTNLLTSMDLGSQILPNEGESLRTKCREIALSVIQYCSSELFVLSLKAESIPMTYDEQRRILFLSSEIASAVNSLSVITKFNRITLLHRTPSTVAIKAHDINVILGLPPIMLPSQPPLLKFKDESLNTNSNSVLGSALVINESQVESKFHPKEKEEGKKRITRIVFAFGAGQKTAQSGEGVQADQQRSVMHAVYDLLISVEKSNKEGKGLPLID